MEVKRSNSKALQGLQLKLEQLEKVQAKTGWFETSKYEDGTPAAYVAAIQEFGCADTGGGVIPPRPFMRTTASEKQKEWADIAGRGAKQIVKGNLQPEDLMEMLGARAEGDVSKKMAEIVSPPLSPVTIELRAMRRANPDLKVTAATVGIAADKVKSPGYTKPSVSDKPLNDTGYLISQLTHVTEKS